MRFEGFSTENRRLVQTISTSAGTLSKDIFETHDNRLLSRGGHFTAGQMLPVYFAALLGVPSESDFAEYHNMLYELRENLIRCPKIFLYIENHLSEPSQKEISLFNVVSKDDTHEMQDDFASLIKIYGDDIRSELACSVYREFTERMLSGSPVRLYEYSVSLITWLNRCVLIEAYKNRNDEIPVVMYYGEINEAELDFLHFLSHIGMDVIYICCDKSCMNMLKMNNKEGRMQIFDDAFSKQGMIYPVKSVKTKYKTAAYSASRELDTVLYDGSAVFRDFQYSNLEARTLKTTFDEINILWHQQSKFRSGFETENDTAFVPNLFVKISGVRDGDLNDYWDDVKYKLSPLTVLMNKGVTADKINQGSLRVYNQFISGDSFLIEKFKKSPYNKYDFLSDSLQNLIFRKMQEAAGSGFLKLEADEKMQLILYVASNIERKILKLLQKFDFTKDIPKIIIIDRIEDTFSKTECIQLVMYNLLGFDIAVITPTGYRNLETYINESAFEIYTMNEYVHKCTVPRFKLPDEVPDYIPKTNGSGLLKNLFKKGKI